MNTPQEIIDRVSKPHVPGTPYEDNYDSQEITLERLQELMPTIGIKRKRPRKATPEMLEMVKNMEKDTGILQQYLEEQVISSHAVLAELKISFKSYLDAIKFVALRNDMNITKAWSIVFPKKYNELLRKQKNGEDVNITNYASAYNKTKAVQLLTKQTLLHASISYAPSHARAMEKITELMEGKEAGGGKVSPKVQLDAAIALEAATRVPEDKTLKVSISQSDAQLEQQQKMNENISRLVESMQQGFRDGKDAADIQKLHVEVIDTEIE